MKYGKHLTTSTGTSRGSLTVRHLHSLWDTSTHCGTPSLTMGHLQSLARAAPRVCGGLGRRHSLGNLTVRRLRGRGLLLGAAFFFSLHSSASERWNLSVRRLRDSSLLPSSSPCTAVLKKDGRWRIKDGGIGPLSVVLMRSSIRKYSLPVCRWHLILTTRGRGRGRGEL